MRLTVPLVILEVIDILSVARSKDFHRLQKLYKLVEIWLSIDPEDVRKVHRACIQIAQTDHQQMDHVLEEIKLLAMCLHRTNQTHTELLGKLRALRIERIKVECVKRFLVCR